MSELDRMLPVLRATDAILLLLKTTFANPRLFGDQPNSLLFNEKDPKGSAIWICDPDSRVTNERDGSRQIITVQRGDYIPQNMHLGGFGGGTISGAKTQSDLAMVPVWISCEDGSKLSSERLAAICYEIIKKFRFQLMAEYDFVDLKVTAIEAPVKQPEVPGSPWLTRLTLTLQVQEISLIGEIANNLGSVSFAAKLGDPAGPRPITVDTSVDPAFPDR